MRKLTRASSLIVAGILVLGVVASTPLSKTPNAEAATASSTLLPSPCSLIPEKHARDICEAATNPNGTAGKVVCNLDPEPTSREICNQAVNGVTDPVGTIASAAGIPSVSGAIGGLAAQAGESLMTWLTAEVAKGVAYLLKMEYDFINGSTSPDLQSRGFMQEYNVVLWFAGIIAAIMFMGAMVEGGFKSDLTHVSKTFGRAVLFVAFAGVLPLVLMRLVDYTDNTLSPLLMQKAGTDANDSLNGLVQAFDGGATAVGVPLILLFVTGALGILGGVLTEFILLLRDLMLYIFIAGEAIAFALWIGGRDWGGWMSTNTKNLLGLAFLKPFMSFIFILGLGLISAHDSMQTLLLGALVLFTLPVSAIAFYAKFQQIHEISPSSVRGYATQGYGYARQGLRKFSSAP